MVSQPSTSTVEPDMPGIVLLYDVFCSRHVFIHTECCCRPCWCSGPVLLLQQLLLSVVACRMAKKILRLHSIWIHPVFSLSSFKQGASLMYIRLRSTVAFTALVCLYYVLGNCGHARSQGGSGKMRHQTKKSDVKKTGIRLLFPQKVNDRHLIRFVVRLGVRLSLEYGRSAIGAERPILIPRYYLPTRGNLNYYDITSCSPSQV